MTINHVKKGVSSKFQNLTKKNTLLNISKLLNSATISATCDLFRKEISRRIFSNETALIFHYDLSTDIVISEPDIPLVVRPLSKDDDFQELLVRHSGILNSMELRTRLECLLFINSGISTCYAGFAQNGDPVVIIWMITPDMNARLQQYFRKGVLPLRHDEVLCEFVFTHADFRGHRLHTWLTLKLFEIAKNAGATRAIAYVPIKNKMSLYVTEKFGWKPLMTKKVYRRLFKRRIVFSPYSGVEPE